MLRAILSTLFILSILNLSIDAQTSIQEANENNQNSLEGILRDMNLDERVPFGKVALYQNGKLIYGEETDIGGQYKFSNIDAGSYQVKASFYGYDFIDITEVKVENGKLNIADLDLRLKNELFAPLAVVSKEITKTTKMIKCFGTLKNTQYYVSAENIESEPWEVDTRTKPRPAERDPYDTPSDLLLYPNPSTGLITIELEFEQLNIQLINTLGHVLESIEYSEIEEDMVQIDLSAQAAGTYFLNITHDQGTQVEKVIIVHL